MKWRQPIIVLFVMGLVVSTLTLGPWGSFFYLLLCLKLVMLLAEFMAAVAPLWLLRRQVQRDVVDPSGAIRAGMTWWFIGYVVVCVLICWLPWWKPFFIPEVLHRYVWGQYLLAALVTALLGAVIFALKWQHYNKLNAAQRLVNEEKV